MQPNRLLRKYTGASLAPALALVVLFPRSDIDIDARVVGRVVEYAIVEDLET